MPRRRPEPLAVPNEPIGAGLPEEAAGEAGPAVAAGAPEGSPDVAGSDMCCVFFVWALILRGTYFAKASKVSRESGGFFGGHTERRNCGSTRA